jgi:hypothetical protein
MLRPAALVLGLAALAGAAAAAEPESLAGVVFEDLDGDGRRGAGEPGVAGVAVSNGLDVAHSDAEGRFALPALEAGAFVFLTRPSGFDAPVWFHAAAQGGGDFALRRRAGAERTLFFVQISDMHAYDRSEDFFEWSAPDTPAWLPRGVFTWVARWLLRRGYPERSAAEIDAELRSALAASTGEDASDLAGGELLEAYLAEFERPGSALGAVAGAIRGAARELAALRPAFLVSTGDLVLEGNTAPSEVVSRWLAFYREALGPAGERYDTIGNNELVGILDSAVSPEHPDYGDGLWRRSLGPTYYSFDRGQFHFVALDTHRPAPALFDAGAWSLVSMREPVREWLARDLALHAGRTLVVLNHEPFRSDPSWPFEYEPAADEGLFARHGVRYVLAGHLHLNGVVREGAIDHVTTGALSGFRWLLPPGLHERGYRLWIGRDGRLFGAWKRTGEPVLARAEPAAEPGELVVVAADRAGPFAALELAQAGEPLAFERWGDYFAYARVDAARGPVAVRALREDGSAETTELSLPAP